MSDLFHQSVPDAYISEVAKVMSTVGWHTYQVLTKRAPRLRSLLSTELSLTARQPHIWWGVSVEDKRYGVPRIEELRNTPAKVRFLSIEPLLEDLGGINLEGIHWVIVGGESGRGSRPIRPEWVLNLLEQCRSAKVPFFSNSGAEFKRNGPVEFSKGSPMTNIPRSTECRSPKPEYGGPLLRSLNKNSARRTSRNLGKLNCRCSPINLTHSISRADLRPIS
jgi:protein gp37